MRRILAVSLVALLTLAACNKQEPAAENGFDEGPGTGGRYHGIGIYSVNQLWEQLVQKAPPKGAPPRNTQAAVLADDTEIIVSVDSRTGEVRQCGNYSGNCISSNPWKTEPSASPAALTKHAADLAREYEAQQRTVERSLRAVARTQQATVPSNSSEPQD